MSWSLSLRNGDFVVDGTRLGTVTGSKKLVQDLRCAILEHMGTDNLHPGYGSLIDGGRTPEGRMVEGVIGETDLDLVALQIESELGRLARQHQGVQLARARQDKLVYGKATLSPGEVLYELVEVAFSPHQDSLRVKARIRTADNRAFDFDVPIDLDAPLLPL